MHGTRLYVTVLMTFLLAAGCSPGPESALGPARDAYAAGDFDRAMALFGEARSSHPEWAEAQYGYARSASTLHLYEASYPAYRAALQIAPDDGMIWEDYTQALAWGGLLKGRADWLEQAMQKSHEALLHVQDRPAIYDNLATAAGQLKAFSRQQAILADLMKKFPNAPVPEANGWIVRLLAARNGSTEEDEASLKETLADRVEAWGVVPFETLSPPEVYRLWRCTQLLERTADATAIAQRVWDRGMRDATEKVVCFRSLVLDGVMQGLQSRDGRAVLQVVETYRPGFPATWQDGGMDHRALLQYEDQGLRQVLAASEDLTGADAPRVTRLIELAEDAFRYDTYGRLAHLYSAAGFLVDHDLRPEKALELADTGLQALDDGMPALFYPGSTAYELTESEKDYRARLLRVRGEALAGMGRADEAAEALEAAVAAKPDPQEYAALGAFRLERGEAEGAYDAYLWATVLAERQESSAASSYREGLDSAARTAGVDAAAVSRDLRSRAGEAEERHLEELVGERLDAEMPAFALEDLDGRIWKNSDLTGKVVVMNYWATWCGPCIQEMPFYAQLVEEYEPDGKVKFLAVDTDEDRSLVPPFLKEKGYGFTVVYDEGTEIALNITGIPTTIILGPEGRIQYRQVGFSGEKTYLEEMRLRIDALIKQ